MKGKWFLIPSKEKVSIIGRYKDTGNLVLNNFTSDISRGENYNVYIAINEKIGFGDFGVGYAHGLFNNPSHYLFVNDGSSVGKLNSICDGAMKIIASNDPKLPLSNLGIDFIHSLLFYCNSTENNSPISGDVEILIDSKDYTTKIKII